MKYLFFIALFFRNHFPFSQKNNCYLKSDTVFLDTTIFGEVIDFSKIELVRKDTSIVYDLKEPQTLH